MLADTTLLIDFLRGKKEAVAALEKMAVSVLYTTEVNVFELVTGVHIGKKNVKSHLEKVHALIAKMIVLPLDRKASMKAAEIAGKLIKEGKQIEETDCLIAGIALANGISKILTENKKHYERIPGLHVISY